MISTGYSQVDGHTDNLPVRAGRYTDNWDLSTERALSVEISVMQGVPKPKISRDQYGEFPLWQVVKRG